MRRPTSGNDGQNRPLGAAGAGVPVNTPSQGASTEPEQVLAASPPSPRMRLPTSGKDGAAVAAPAPPEDAGASLQDEPPRTHLKRMRRPTSGKYAAGRMRRPTSGMDGQNRPLGGAGAAAGAGAGAGAESDPVLAASPPLPRMRLPTSGKDGAAAALGPPPPTGADPVKRPRMRVPTSGKDGATRPMRRMRRPTSGSDGQGQPLGAAGAGVPVNTPSQGASTEPEQVLRQAPPPVMAAAAPPAIPPPSGSGSGSGSQ